jgi:lysozyme
MGQCVEDLIAKHEGRVNAQYLDSLGIPTIGIGHNCQAHPLPPGWTSPLSDAQVDQLFSQDLAITCAQMFRSLPWASSLDPVRQSVLVDMAFNMGLGALLGFKHTLSLVESGDYAAAAAAMLESTWAVQVGQRAQENSAMMRSGQWPANL